MSEDVPDEPRLSFEVTLDAPPEKVWRALTVPAYLERWLLPLEATGTGRFAGTAPALGQRVEVTVLDAEPFRQLRWHWREGGDEAGLVTLTLTPRADGGTSLSLLHERRITALLMPAPANGNATMALAA